MKRIERTSRWWHAALGFMLVVGVSPLHAQTTSDACSMAAGQQYPVNGSCVTQAFNKPSGFVPNMASTGCGAGLFDDAFGWFTATSTTTVISFTTNTFNANPILHLYSGNCAALVSWGCANATGASLLFPVTETINAVTVPGQTYVVRVQNAGNNNAFNGTICIWSPPPPPVNDNCANAIDLPVFFACFMQNFTNVSATASGAAPAPACSSAPNTDVWFRFVAPPSGVVFIESQAGTLTDGAFQLYSGTCGAMALVPNGCDDDSGPGNMPYEERRCAPLTPGATYYIRYWGYNNSSGTFGLCVHGPDVFPTPQQDCTGGFTICNSGPINNNADWTGCTQDLGTTNRGCLLSNERQGTWYYFSPQSAGTIGFQLQPINNLGNPVNVDYDFAIWGPMNTISCPPAAPPLRCSYAYPPNAGTWLTGMAAGNTDVSEAASGTGVNGFVSPITVGAANINQVYVMYVDNFDITGQAFNLNWNLSTPGMLDCTVLPVEVLDLKAVAMDDRVHVEWTTQTASQSTGYVVEHSTNGHDFIAIGALDAGTASAGITEHQFPHKDPVDGMNYYRLKLLGSDGEGSHTHVVSVLVQRGRHVLLPRPNPAHSTVQFLLPKGLAGPVDVHLTDASGRLVGSRSLSDPEEGGALDLNVEGMDGGYYLLHLYDGHGELLGTGRFIKE